MPNYYSIEFAQPYDNEPTNNYPAGALALQSLLTRTREEGKGASLVALVDDTTYEDKDFDFNKYANWLHSEGFDPDLVAMESQILPVCDELFNHIDFAQLNPELAEKLQSDQKYISELTIAAWCLLRLGLLESDAFDPALQAEKLMNILPASFKPTEDGSLEIIRATPYASAADRIEYTFIPDAA